MKSYLAILTLAFGLSAGAQAQTPTCSFPIHKGFPEKYKAMLQEDLNFLASMKGSAASPFHARYFGSAKVDGRVYCNFLKKRIRSFRFVKGHPFVGRHNNDDSISLAKMFFEQEQGFRLAIIIHEAMHVWGAKYEWHHHNCPDPYKGDDGREPLVAGYPRCDSTVHSAHGIAYIWSQNVVRFCENCDPDFKKGTQEGAKFFYLYIDRPSTRKFLRKDAGLE